MSYTRFTDQIHFHAGRPTEIKQARGPPKGCDMETNAMELLFGVTDDELIAAMDSRDPNDQAFLASMAALVRAWSEGDAIYHLLAARALMQGERVIGEKTAQFSRN